MNENEIADFIDRVGTLEKLLDSFRITSNAPNDKALNDDLCTLQIVRQYANLAILIARWDKVVEQKVELKKRRKQQRDHKNKLSRQWWKKQKEKKKQKALTEQKEQKEQEDKNLKAEKEQEAKEVEKAKEQKVLLEQKKQKEQKEQKAQRGASVYWTRCQVPHTASTSYNTGRVPRR